MDIEQPKCRRCIDLDLRPVGDAVLTRGDDESIGLYYPGELCQRCFESMTDQGKRLEDTRDQRPLGAFPKTGTAEEKKAWRIANLQKAREARAAVPAGVDVYESEIESEYNG